MEIDHCQAKKLNKNLFEPIPLSYSTKNSIVSIRILKCGLCDRVYKSLFEPIPLNYSTKNPIVLISVLKCGIYGLHMRIRL